MLNAKIITLHADTIRPLDGYIVALGTTTDRRATFAVESEDGETWFAQVDSWDVETAGDVVSVENLEDEHVALAVTFALGEIEA